MEVHHVRDEAFVDHLKVARRVLALPVSASRLHWHPFGVYAIPLPKRHDERGSWSRRLHVWHPEATPVGEASPYGVHTHSGEARSHVLLGALRHHLYAFEEGDGPWRMRAGEVEARARLRGHVEATTKEGFVHTLPKDRPHGVTKPPGLAISLFEQRDATAENPFTTWQRQDVEPVPVVTCGPAATDVVRSMALLAVEERLFQVGR